MKHGLAAFEEAWVIGPVANLYSQRYANGATRLQQHVGERANMLDCSDIEGTQAGTKGCFMMRTSPMRHSGHDSSRSLRSDDIQGQLEFSILETQLQ